MSNEPYTYTNNHSFHPGIAKDYGVNCAILVGHIHFWVTINKANKVNLHDGRTWMYQTLDQMLAIFPYWTRRQVEKCVNKCVDRGMLIRGNYNRTKYDRTVWYAFENEVKFGISPIGEMDHTKTLNGEHRKVTPIQYTKTDTEEQLLPNPLQSEKREEVVVSLPSFLSEVNNLSQEDALKLMKGHHQAYLQEKVDVLNAYTEEVDSVYAFLRKALDEDWKLRAKAADKAPENRKWSQDVMDGKTIGSIRVEALNKHLEFVHGGQKPPDCFDYELANFQEIVGAHYRTMLSRSKGP